MTAFAWWYWSTFAFCAVVLCALVVRETQLAIRHGLRDAFQYAAYRARLTERELRKNEDAWWADRELRASEAELAVRLFADREPEAIADRMLKAVR